MAEKQTLIVHGTAVALPTGGDAASAVLLRGMSGMGKSDLAFRLIAKGGMLISDDQVLLERRVDNIIASSAASIAGLLEVRGVGLLKYPTAVHTRLHLVVDLVQPAEVPRMPEWETVDMLGVAVPRLKLHSFDASTPLKIIKAIELVHKPHLLVR